MGILSSINFRVNDFLTQFLYLTLLFGIDNRFVVRQKLNALYQNRFFTATKNVYRPEIVMVKMMIDSF